MTKLHLITIPVDFLEQTLECKIDRKVISLGLDTATKSGWCIAKVDNGDVLLSIGFINIDVKSIKDKDIRNELRYNAIYDTLKGLIKPEYKVVIENVFYGGNAQTLILLARIGAIAWCVCKEKGVSNIIWKSAVQARTVLNMKGKKIKKDKKSVMLYVNELLGTELSNSDELDAIVLALNGLIKV